MRACRPGPFKNGAYYCVLLRITAYYRVLNGAYYRLAPPGPQIFWGPAWGAKGVFDTSILERMSIRTQRFKFVAEKKKTDRPLGALQEGGGRDREEGG